ncbi:putative serine/threonine protein kinase [Corchorus capsularis]|uniref:Putative serine/threonine protein kinase n=1 Tax=Corchorus capsularis TaxID=210143 RepID=A0A1R3HGV3_COCAP|nr:putative serine/threonine protein kinase [Corchorus capsularis]
METELPGMPGKFGPGPVEPVGVGSSSKRMVGGTGTDMKSGGRFLASSPTLQRFDYN